MSAYNRDIWDVADWTRIYSHAETRRIASKVRLGPTRISFQAAVGPGAVGL